VPASPTGSAALLSELVVPTGRFVSCVLEAEMLNRDEHDTLRRIELNMAAADPKFASLLRNGQRRLLHYRRRKLLRRRALIALLLLLAYVLLVLRLPSSALAVGVLAAGAWWLRRWPIVHQA
jgi:hypothetical protein